MTNTYDILLHPLPSQPTKAAEQKPEPHLRANQQTSHVAKQPVSKRVNHQTSQFVNPLPVIHEQRPREASKQAVKPDVMLDVTTSVRQAVDLKNWQELIENTETQNSALRLTSAERYVVEDVVNELRRQYGIKTSMNELARLGLLLLIHDFKQHKKESLIHTVKKA